MGVFRYAESDGSVHYSSKSIFVVESNRIDRFPICEQIDSGRLFQSWSIFDETRGMGVSRGAESNGGVRFSSK